MISGSLVTKWFVGKQLTFALAFIQTNLRIYEILTSYISKPLYDIDDNLFWPLFVGSLFCLMSWLVMSIGTIIMDRRLDK